MPQYIEYLGLEYDATESRGGGRVPQEMAKTRFTGLAAYYPRGLHRNQIEAKERKTLAAVGARRTRVTRTDPDQV